MPDDPDRASVDAGQPGGSEEVDVELDLDVEGAAEASVWSNLWQVPAIVVSLILIGLGLVVAGGRSDDQRLETALEQVERRIVRGELETARTALQEVIPPLLGDALPSEEGRYHAAVADWVAEHQRVRGTRLEKDEEVIAERYGEAVACGVQLTPARIERWAVALIELSLVDEARNRLSELEALSVSEAGGPDARLRRNRVMRRLVERSLDQEDLSLDEMVALVESYRDEDGVSTPDRAWASARLAQLRLEDDDAAGAVRHLLVDMRRLEEGRPPLDGPAWAELYALLGRGYYHQGMYDHAAHHLRTALDRADRTDPIRGDALLLIGRIDTARGDLERGLETFEEIVRDFESTRAYLPALLSRAEARSILGEHEAAIADYRTLINELMRTAPRRDLSRRSVAVSLADRHDAALTVGDLDLAFQYVSLAEPLFDGAEVPIDVLRRIASTSRQIADNIMAAALETLPPEDRLSRMDEVTPAVRHRAGTNYQRSAEYFLRHARALTATPGADDRWAESLWMAADGYDRAGRRGLAIEHFLEYVEGRPMDDPRRAEVTHRLAQAYAAELKFEEAARFYDQVIDEHPRSPYGTQSHVPLARCYLALDRRPEAEQQLRQVLEGRYPLSPDAIDYRHALLELGKIHYDAGELRPAIERLSEAMERYPDDHRREDIRFRLADSKRRHALALRSRLASEANMPPAERLELTGLVHELLDSSLTLFRQTCAGYAAEGMAGLNGLQRQYLRLAWLYRADCAYELERYESAAKLYDQAARKFSEHHSSMHALVQIVNCFDHLGDTERADIAHHNALVRLRQLPDDAFDASDALMDRAAWEQWLQNRPIGLAQGGAGAAAN